MFIVLNITTKKRIALNMYDIVAVEEFEVPSSQTGFPPAPPKKHIKFMLRTGGEVVCEDEERERLQHFLNSVKGWGPGADTDFANVEDE